MGADWMLIAMLRQAPMGFPEDTKVERFTKIAQNKE